MKALTILALGFALLVGCSENVDDPQRRDQILSDALNQENLQYRGRMTERLAYSPNSEAPYTGWVKAIHRNGETKELIHFRNGKEDGLWVSWYPTGQKELEIHFKSGEQHGPYFIWHDNGQMQLKAEFKNGKFDGLVTTWDEDGTKIDSIRYKEGEPVE